MSLFIFLNNLHKIMMKYSRKLSFITIMYSKFFFHCIHNHFPLISYILLSNNRELPYINKFCAQYMSSSNTSPSQIY